LSEASEIIKLESPLLRTKTYRAGNVDLKLIEMIKKENSLNVLLGTDRLGLRYVTLKVSNIQNAIAYLKSQRIDFTENAPSAFDDSKSALICPKEIGGIPIFLKEGSHEGATTP
jgi:hypothetical protein